MQKNNNLKKDNWNLKNEKDQAVRDKEKAFTDTQNLKDILEAQLKTLEGENEKLSKENNKFKSSSYNVEEELRKQFAARLGEILQDRDDHYNRLKAQTDEANQKQMEDKEKNLDKQIE